MRTLQHGSAFSAVGPVFILVVALAFGSCGGRVVRTTVDNPAHVDVAQLWTEPHDIATRDLFHGSGGAELMPDPSAEYQFVGVDTKGYSPGYEVRAPDGLRWDVKLGSEAQPEVVSSRVLWAIGYHQPPTYLLQSWKLVGAEAGTQPASRFRPDLPNHNVVSDWSWHENPFVSTQPFRGLIVANLMLNNWDWKTSNNKVYEISFPDGAVKRVYTVRDLGASLGKTSFPKLLKWFPIRGFGQGSRNDLSGFEEQGFILGVEGNRVNFDYKGIYDSLVETVSVGDVVWTCQLMARIVDQQWRDAFRAAGYSEGDADRYIAKLKTKIAEGLALAP